MAPALRYRLHPGRPPRRALTPGPDARLQQHRRLQQLLQQRQQTEHELAHTLGSEADERFSEGGAFDDPSADEVLLGHPQVLAQLQATHTLARCASRGSESEADVSGSTASEEHELPSLQPSASGEHPVDESGQDAQEEAWLPVRRGRRHGRPGGAHVWWSEPPSTLVADEYPVGRQEESGLRADTIRYLFGESICKLRSQGCSLAQIELFISLMAERVPIPTGAIEAGLHWARGLFAIDAHLASIRADAAAARVAS